jgi:hypothetical protein
MHDVGPEQRGTYDVDDLPHWLGRLFASPAQVRAAQHSDDAIHSPAVGQRCPVDQPVPVSHARPRQTPVLIS